VDQHRSQVYLLFEGVYRRQLLHQRQARELHANLRKAILDDSLKEMYLKTAQNGIPEYKIVLQNKDSSSLLKLRLPTKGSRLQPYKVYPKLRRRFNTTTSKKPLSLTPAQNKMLRATCGANLRTLTKVQLLARQAT
jgi:hypothetical protein